VLKFHGENGAGKSEACRVGSVFLGVFPREDNKRQRPERMLSIFGRRELPTMCFFLFWERTLKTNLAARFGV
jgi:hypothetical protein